MSKSWLSVLEVNLFHAEEREQFRALAVQRRWGPALVLVGWLHLAAFSLCYYLTVGCNYHESAGYLAIWVTELLTAWAIFRLCAGPRPAHQPVSPLEQFVRRVWITYFILAFNLGTLNTLRGNHLFEFFPAMASLASFGFLMMTVTISGRFFLAVLIMFSSGLLMAAYLLDAYLIFALAWWVVLNAIGLPLCRRKQRSAAQAAPHSTRLADAGDPQHKSCAKAV